jgi:TolB protein
MAVLLVALAGVAWAQDTGGGGASTPDPPYDCARAVTTPPPDKAGNQPPYIVGLNPSADCEVSDLTPTIRATVGDDTAELYKSDIRFFFDGASKDAFTYSRLTDQFSYLSPEVAPGTHTVTIRAHDRSGRVGTVTWQFSVGDPGCEPAPGGDGTIVFGQGSKTTGNIDIYAMSPDGTGLQQLTDDPILDTAPALSPDGCKIAWSRGGETWKMKRDGSGKVKLADAGNSTLWNQPTPAFSPDGREIAFSRDNDIWLMNIDGTGQRQLTDDLSVDYYPTWSPDGSKIAFSSDPYLEEPESGAQPDIVVANTDGTGEQKIMDGNDIREYMPESRDGVLDPDWSPDGGAIAFQTWVFDPNQPSDPDLVGRILTMKPDGTGLQTVVDLRGVQPTFSPDGSKIAYNNGAGGIKIVNRDGTASQATGVAGSVPDWGP